MAHPYVSASYPTDYTTANTSKEVVADLPANAYLFIVVQGSKNAATTAPTIPGISITSFGGSGDATYPLNRSYYGFIGSSPQSNVTITITESNGSVPWGFTCFIISNAFFTDSVSTLSASGSPSMSLTISYTRELVMALVADSSAADGSSRVWRTADGQTPTSSNGQELAYNYVSSNFTGYVAQYPVAGTGTKTIGLSAPSMTYRMTYVIFTGDDAPNFMVNGTITAATANSLSKATFLNPTAEIYRRNMLAIVTVYVGVRPGDGNDSSVTTTATMDGRAMTSLAKIHSNAGSQGYVELFYLFGPPDSAPSISVSCSTTADLNTTYVYYYNVDLTNPFKEVKTASGSSTSAQVSFTDITNRNTIYAAVVSANNISSTSIGSGGAQLFSNISNFNNSSSGGCAAQLGVGHPSNTQSVGWTVTSGEWAMISVALNPSSYFPPQAINGFIA